MGKIHDALQRAEEERLRQERASAAPAAEAPAASPSSRSAHPRDSRDPILSGRRARVITAGDSAVGEEYRTLRARLQSLRRKREIRSFVLTSAIPGEGKTTTAVNLALSFGLDLGTTTCLVDADMRTPSVHRAFAQLPAAGLAEVLETDAKLEDALLQVPETRLWVLPVKGLPGQPSELLASQRMVRLLEELAARFDTVVIDAPPLLGLPDAVTLVDLCDATLLVVGAGESPRAHVETALERLDRRKVIGCVFNRCETSSPAEEYYGRGS
jgi:capsular exopolysaccharide synthesis family protein